MGSAPAGLRVEVHRVLPLSLYCVDELAVPAPEIEHRCGGRNPPRKEVTQDAPYPLAIFGLSRESALVYFFEGCRRWRDGCGHVCLSATLANFCTRLVPHG